MAIKPITQLANQLANSPVTPAPVPQEKPKPRKNISVSISQELYNALENYKYEHRQPNLSAIIQEAIKQYIGIK